MRAYDLRTTSCRALALGALSLAFVCSFTGQSDAPAAPKTPKRVRLSLGESQLEQLPLPGGVAEPLPAAQSAPAARTETRPDPQEDRKSELLFAPIPVSSEAIGIGLAPVAAYVFFPSKSDRFSPPSILAVAGLYTSTRTYGFGLGGLLNLKEDRYRITFLLGGARARYEFFGIGAAAGSTYEPVWLSQRGNALMLQGLRRLKGNIFVGPRFVHRQIKADRDADEGNPFPDQPPLAQVEGQLNFKIKTAALGFRVERDTRDNMFYPTRGSSVDGRADFFGPYVGSTFSFQSYQLEANKYLPVGKRHVVALRGMACGVTGDRVPFYELCQFGTLGDLRGYQMGRYRDATMFATQAEWRFIVWKRLGATVFGGIGEVAPGWNEYGVDDLLPSGGTGLRFNLSKQRRINLRFDLAYSKTGGSWSMGVAEVF